MNIEIVNYTEHASGCLQGFADIKIVDFGLTIQGCKLFKKEDSFWIGLPDKEYTDREGNKKYQKFLIFSKEVDKDFKESARDVIRNSLSGESVENQVTETDQQQAREEIPDDDIPF